MREYKPRPERPTGKSRCTKCGNMANRSVSGLCRTCMSEARNTPLSPCVVCGAPMHRRSSKTRDREEGSKFYGARGRCTGCLKRSYKTGDITANQEKAMVSTPQPRIVVTAKLTLDERSQALCGQVDPELFYMEKGESASLPKSVCAKCPLRAASLGGNDRCLEVALINKEAWGVWGGLSVRERQAIRRDRRREEQAA